MNDCRNLKHFSVESFSVPVTNLSVFESEIDSRRRNHFANPHGPRIFIVKILQSSIISGNEESINEKLTKHCEINFMNFSFISALIR